MLALKLNKIKGQGKRGVEWTLELYAASIQVKQESVGR
jgi:hypothetical protein